MKILQMHVDFIEYKPIQKEIAGAEEADAKQVREDELVVLFTAVESGDDSELASRAVSEARDFLSKLGTKRVMIYPFAHLSQNLAKPSDALPVLLAMEADARKAGLEVMRAPFGWNKALQVKVKGHPLAEMSRSYSHGAQQMAAPAKPKRELSESELLARLKKSDFGSLPDTDHRVIGERLDLFSFQEPSPGMVYWHEKGWRLRNILVDFLRKELARRGYQEISTPALANTTLWRVSGHSELYAENMFLTKLGDEDMGMKPMNCPSTFLIYKSRKWSYRELPVRYAIFDPLYRNELSGVASGLLRVKALTQDDAHVICTEDQAEKKLSDMLDFMADVYGIFKLEYKAKLSTRPDETMGTDEEWRRATDILRRVMEAKGLGHEEKPKEGTFYGPKIDVDIKDSLGREWQCGTFQVDLQMPKRFKMVYTGSDGHEHTPVVLHRTLLGSLERFIGVMLEHFGGRLPLWLSPVQAKVIPVTDASRDYAQDVLKRLLESGVRAEGDFESGTMNAKVRQAQIQRIPAMLVVGEKEAKSGTVAVRDLSGKTNMGVGVDQFILDVAARTKRFE
jgi:threonyl-tRNA synthetase